MDRIPYQQRPRQIDRRLKSTESQVANLTVDVSGDLSSGVRAGFPSASDAFQIFKTTDIPSMETVGYFVADGTDGTVDCSAVTALLPADTYVFQRTFIPI